MNLQLSRLRMNKVFISSHTFLDTIYLLTNNAEAGASVHTKF